MNQAAKTRSTWRRRCTRKYVPRRCEWRKNIPRHQARNLVQSISGRGVHVRPCAPAAIRSPSRSRNAFRQADHPVIEIAPVCHLLPVSRRIEFRRAVSRLSVPEPVRFTERKQCRFPHCLREVQARGSVAESFASNGGLLRAIIACCETRLERFPGVLQADFQVR